MKTLEERLGQKIGRQRRAVGLSQAQLAEKVDVQPETISRIETGKKGASVGLLAQISDVLELDLHEMFHLLDGDSPRDRAIENLLRYVARLSTEEIELVLNVAAAVIAHTRRGGKPK